MIGLCISVAVICIPDQQSRYVRTGFHQNYTPVTVLPNAFLQMVGNRQLRLNGTCDVVHRTVGHAKKNILSYTKIRNLHR